MAMAAMWLQGADEGLSNAKLQVIFIGLIAVAMAIQAIVTIVLAVRSTALMKGLLESVDELKDKALPLLRSATELSIAAHSMVLETAPKVRVITDNLVDASNAVRESAEHIDRTVSDVNRRTQRQIARVDGMVSTVLSVTAELAETIDHGIRVPAQKIAGMASQAKLTLESLLERAKWMAAGIAAGKRRE